MNVAEILKSTRSQKLYHPDNKITTHLPEVSVLLVLDGPKNSLLYEKTIISVLKQALVKFELVIVDDTGRADLFSELKKLFSETSGVIYIRHETPINNLAISLFEAFIASKGEYIIFAVGNPIYDSKALFNLVSKAKGAMIVAGYSKVGTQYLNYLTSANEGNICLYNYLSNSAILIHRNVFKEIGWLDPSPIVKEHVFWDIWRRASVLYDIKNVKVFVNVISHHSSSVIQDYELNEYLCSKERQHLLAVEEFLHRDITGNVPSSLYPPGHILLICQGITASLMQAIWGLKPDLLGRILVMHADLVLPEHLLKANAVIFFRSLFNSTEKDLFILCRRLHIPSYYYLDDNFWVLDDVHKAGNKIWSDFSYARNIFTKFTAILASTEALKNFILQHDLNTNVYIMPQVEVQVPTPKCNNTFSDVGFSGATIAFMGQSHRLQALEEFVIPAINNLALKYRIRFIFAGFSPAIATRFSKKVKLVFVEATYLYTSLIRRLKKYKIDILVHPSVMHANMEFKTLNVLLNASLINAVPVLSSVPPYTSGKITEAALLCDNSVESWQGALEMLIANNSLKSNMLYHCGQYIKVNYSGRITEDILVNIIKNNPIVNIDTRRKDYQDISSILKVNDLNKYILYNPGIKLALYVLCKNLIRKNKILYKFFVALNSLAIFRKLVLWIKNRNTSV